MPEVRRPPGEGVGEAFCSISVSDLRQKGFCVTVSISSLASGEQGQSISRVAAQIPRAMQSDHPKKEQRQEQSLAYCRRTAHERRSSLCLLGWQCVCQMGKQRGLVGRCQQEQTARMLVVSWLKQESGLRLFFLAGQAGGSTPSVRGRG